VRIDPAEYGERWAESYDELFPAFPDQDDCIAFLTRLAAGGSALELAIGTGRVALPLIEQGVEVHGVDISEAMVDRLRAKPGGNAVPVYVGDFADVPVEGHFRLIYLVFNTFFALLTQEDQLRCFENVARHLDPAGAFVLECFLPDLTLFNRGQRVQALESSTDRIRVDVGRLDLVNQRIDSNHVVLSEAGTKMLPVHIRYAWPAELDLMAKLASMELRERWGGWAGQPFTSTSAKHVSVYQPVG
jgi:SAM-dependent methyltransferase